ncbi:L-threonylcarbamoyladenylate synthase [Propioniciclava soli]|uniref:L-threonylcarbamoyladenylate synthase n=1 Tax=Propioniciclava soli TaxID=2775081 RepID=A0ABZ3C5U0_9ACTN
MNDRIWSTGADLEAAYDAATDAVAAGQVIVLPTDTVYGVGADALNAEAVQRLLDAKQRGREFPPPVLVAEVPMLRALAEGVDDRVRALAEAFWPGALTLVLRSAPTLRMDLGDRGDTIAVRVPDHDLTRELLRRTGPLAVSSANVHGADAALTAEDAAAQLGDAVAVYLDGGPGSGPVPSTIVDLTGEQARVLREGRITVADLNNAVPGLIPEPEPGAAEPEASVPAEAVPEQVAQGEAAPEEGSA